MSETWRLIGDIGGTNARFAISRSAGSYDGEQVYNCADFASADAAIAHYLSAAGLSDPEAICLAVAGPVIAGTVSITNNAWQLSAADLAARLGSPRVRLANDFEALARAIPALGDEDVTPIGCDGPPRFGSRDLTVGVVGPGTGLGVATLIRRNGVVHALAGEGGHVGFAPENETQSAVRAGLVAEFGRVSDERLASGRGVENIYRALVARDRNDGKRLGAAEVFAAAADGDASADEAVEMFYEVLGQVAGNLALVVGATDGVFVAGGVAQRYPERLASGRFRAGFENKGRHRAIAERIPTWLITHAQPGLVGASLLATD